ncbi:MAG: hypothetical protein J6W75_00395 [Bacteroidaceae bacterium]|nr:hypothetical protein [Bacteroidaceae bacterium]
MAKNNNTERKFVRCLDCRHGVFYQYFRNPIVNDCLISGERNVAESRRICSDFSPRTDGQPPQITHYDSYPVQD